MEFDPVSETCVFLLNMRQHTKSSNSPEYETTHKI